MKKLLGIVVLGLLLSGNGFGFDGNIYYFECKPHPIKHAGENLYKNQIASKLIIDFKDGEIFWKSIKIQFNRMINEENWHHSTLDKCDLISVAGNSIQCFVEFNRRDISKKSYGTAKGIWIATFKNNLWALQMRSMIPVSGKISSLAGTKMD